MPRETPSTEHHFGDSPSPEALLQLDKISYAGGKYPALRSVSFDVYPGESVAVTGIRENGLETLEQILSGFLKPDEGEVRFRGEAIQGLPIAELRRRKIAYIPTERLVRGASMDSSVAENMIILNYRDFHSWGSLKKEEIDHFAGTLRRQFNIKADAGDRLAGLSGGNIQKVIISREFFHAPELLIFSEPSWGLDIAGRRFVLEKIQELKTRGSAVLVITSDIEEAMETADRIVVMYRGQVSGIVDGRSTGRSDLGRLMLGVHSYA
jgi:simple sugar transport system ATP-binding protein